MRLLYVLSFYLNSIFVVYSGAVKLIYYSYSEVAFTGSETTKLVYLLFNTPVFPLFKTFVTVSFLFPPPDFNLPAVIFSSFCQFYSLLFCLSPLLVVFTFSSDVP